MSVSSSSTSARSLLSNAEVMTFNLSTRRARLAFTLRSFLSILLLTGWTYASDWGLQMSLVLHNCNTNILSKVWFLLSILAFLTAAWIVVALLRLVWKDRQEVRHYWAWRPSAGAAGGGGTNTSTDREWTRSMPAPSMFFYVSFREAFELEDDQVLSNEDVKQFLVRLLVALHVWPMFMLFLFWPVYMRLLHKYDDWRVSVPSSIILLAVSAFLYKYAVLGCDPNNRATENESFFLFPDTTEEGGGPSSTLSVGLLTPQQQDESDDDDDEAPRRSNRRGHRQDGHTPQPADYRDVENL